MTISVLRVPELVVFGPGCAGRVGEHAKEMGFTRALVVADSNVLAAGGAGPVLDSLRAGGLGFEVVEQDGAEPAIESLKGPLDALRATHADVGVALGGGSTIDVAKGTALVGKLGGSIRDYIGVDRVPMAGLPMIALPTTSGTG